jgi:hypothetical protein
MEFKGILFASLYLGGIIIVILHYTAWLEDRNMQWLVYLMAVAIFPAVIFL